MNDKEFRPLGFLQYKDTLDNNGKNFSATIHIPESLIQERKTEGLTLYLNLFWLFHACLKDRDVVDFKLAIKAKTSDLRIGDKTYTAPYVTAELILPPDEMAKLSQLILPKKEPFGSSR